MLLDPDQFDNRLLPYRKTNYCPRLGSKVGSRFEVTAVVSEHRVIKNIFPLKIFMLSSPFISEWYKFFVHILY